MTRGIPMGSPVSPALQRLLPPEAQPPRPLDIFVAPTRDPASNRDVRLHALRSVVHVQAIQEGECSICNEVIRLAQGGRLAHTICILPCLHSFHKHCWDQLIKAAGATWARCPECRTVLHPGNDIESLTSRVTQQTRHAALSSLSDARITAPPHTVHSIHTAIMALPPGRAAATAAAAAIEAHNQASDTLSALQQLLRRHRWTLGHPAYDGEEALNSSGMLEVD